jgi:hypothetical protein
LIESRFANCLTSRLLHGAACFQEKFSRLCEALLYYVAEISRNLYQKAFALVKNDNLLEDKDKPPKDKTQ